MAKVFLVFTAYQEALARSAISEDGDEGNCILLRIGSVPNFLIGSELARWVGIESLTMLLGSTSYFDRQNGVTIEHVASLCERIAATQMQGVEVIYSSLGHPALNGIYCVLSRNSQISHSLLADGLSAYLPLRQSLKAGISGRIKWALGLLGLGSPYKPISGHPMGLDIGSLFRVWGVDSDSIATKANAKKNVPLPFSLAPDHGFIPNPLFLSQPHLTISSTEKRAYFSRLAERLNYLYGAIPFCKVHPFESKEEISLYEECGFLILEDGGPVEAWLAKNVPPIVLSFRSTALINARKYLPKSTEVVSLDPDLVAPSNESVSIAKLKAVLRSFDIDIWLSGSKFSGLETHSDIRPRILHVITSFSVYGAEKVAYTLAEEFHRRGYQADIAAVRPADDAVNEERIRNRLAKVGVKTTLLSKKFYKWNIYALIAGCALSRVVKKEKYSLIHSHTDIPDFVVALSKVIRGVPVVRTIHNTVLWPGRKLLARIIETVLSPIFEVAVSVEASTEWIRFRRRLGLSSLPRPTVVSNVLGPINFVSREEARRRLSLGDSGKNIALVGRLVPQKGTDLAISAVLDPAWPKNITLHVFGTGELSDKVRQAEHLSKSIRYHGTVMDISSLLKAFDAVLIPSRFEGHPLVLLEALEAGIQAIVAPCPGIRSYLGENYPFYIREISSDGIVDSLNYLDSDVQSASNKSTTLREMCDMYAVAYGEGRYFQPNPST